MYAKRTKKKRRTPPVVYLLGLILLGALIYTVFNMGNALDKPLNASDTQSITVEIPKGATTTLISNILVENHLIKAKFDFKMVSKKMKADGKMKAGRYVFSPSMKPSEMIQRMIEGKITVEGTKVTVPEGYNNRQIIELFVSKGLGTREAFENVLRNDPFDYKFIKGLDRSYQLEGFLFPDTYFVKKNATEHQIVNMMLRRFDQVFKPEYYDRLKELHLSMNEAISLAAIVEREAKRDDERARISGVFLNRIKVNMPLQSCATVQYILNQPKAVLTFKDIKIESPYNTYLHKGLTPSPIASPGEKSIVAALYPEAHDYLYFVVTNNGDGGHYFGKTGAEHLKNIEKSKQNK